MAKIITAYVHDLYQLVDKGEISFSRMVELINEKANAPSEGKGAGEIREILIDFASRNDKFNVINVRDIDVADYLKRRRKDHARSIDDFLKKYSQFRQEVSVETNRDKCDVCYGLGYEDGGGDYSNETCMVCNGTGFKKMKGGNQ